jgi:hypothetical protein
MCAKPPLVYGEVHSRPLPPPPHPPSLPPTPATVGGARPLRTLPPPPPLLDCLGLRTVSFADLVCW